MMFWIDFKKWKPVGRRRFNYVCNKVWHVFDDYINLVWCSFVLRDPTRPDPIRTDFFTYIPRGLKFLKMFRTTMEKFLGPPLVGGLMGYGLVGWNVQPEPDPYYYVSKISTLTRSILIPVNPNPNRLTHIFKWVI